MLNYLTALTPKPWYLRVGAFWLLLLLLWLPLWAVVSTLVENLTLETILVMVGLYGIFLGLLRVWGRQVHGVTRCFEYYGLGWRWNNGRAGLIGLGVGLGLIALLFGLETLFGWVAWNPPPANFGWLLLQGTLLGIAVGTVEELLFRGWWLDELQRDLRPWNAAIWNAVLFATLHFIKPLEQVLQTLPQFLGLVLLGLILSRAKQRTGQLGLSIGLHGGLVWGYYLVDVGDWVVYSDRIPSWLTGINGNPLAGVMGLLLLLAVLIGINKIQLSTFKRPS
jgi:uncharacterized protein